MQEQIIALFEMFFNSLVSLDTSFTSIAGSGVESTVVSAMGNFATAIKSIGYCLLALFALIEFAQLSERVGNVTGFMGTGLVIEVLIKLILCKLVVDNSSEICTFVVGVSEDITAIIGEANITAVDYEQFKQNILNAFPNWWDIFGQLAFFIVSALFIFLSNLAVMFVKVIYSARHIELFVYTAISPIPLSTCLSKHFNAAPNFIKSLFAVALQGSLLLLVIKIFNLIFAVQINSLGTLPVNGWSAIWSMLGSLLFNSVLLLVASFQTQKWAKSICHAM